MAGSAGTETQSLPAHIAAATAVRGVVLKARADGRGTRATDRQAGAAADGAGTRRAKVTARADIAARTAIAGVGQLVDLADLVLVAVRRPRTAQIDLAYAGGARGTSGTLPPSGPGSGPGTAAQLPLTSRMPSKYARSAPGLVSPEYSSTVNRACAASAGIATVYWNCCHPVSLGFTAWTGPNASA